MSCASLASPTLVSLDKESDWFGLSLTDSRGFFDQFLSFDNFDHGDSIFPALPELPTVAKPESDIGSTDTSSSVLEEEVRQLLDLSQGEPELWDHRAADIGAASPIPSQAKIDPSEELGRAEASENDLLSLESITLRSPHGKPTISTSSPTAVPIITHTRRRNRFLEQISKSFKKAPGYFDLRRRSPIRKATCPPKVMGTPYHEQNLNDWKQLMEEAPKFDFGFQDPPDPLSPPPSVRISDASSNSKVVTSADQHGGPFAWDHPLPQQYASRNEAYLDTPLTIPNPELHTFGISNHVFTSPLHNQNASSWTPNASFDYGAAMWWNGAVNTSTVQPQQTVMYPPRSASAHVSLANNNVMPTELSYRVANIGLGTANTPTGQMPNSPAHSQSQSHAVLGPSSSRVEPQVHSHATKSYFGPAGEHRPPAQPHLSHSTPRHRQRHNNTHDISMSGSPQPARQHASPTLPHLSPCKSSCVTSSPSPSPKSRTSSAPFHVAKRRSASQQRRRTSEHAAAGQRSSSTGSRSPRAPRTSKSGSDGGGGSAVVDFVNFTPSDSMKILTGVAPSGSSKTKARREKEALEKRRRLSQAAMRAVQAAGGNIDALVEEGFLV